MDIFKAAGVLIKDRKILVEKSKNKKFFIAPGGSIEKGETPGQALVRELNEEFGIAVKEEDFVEFGSFEAKAAGQEEKIVHMTVFLVTKWIGEPSPNAEVEKVLWITSSDSEDIKIGSIFKDVVIPRLKKQKLID